jgi:ABC-type lipoprotein release transport system permease subunit
VEGSVGLFNSWYEVIGLVRDEKHDGLDQRTTASVFLPYAKALRGADNNDSRSLHEMSVILRGSLDPNMFVGEAQEVVRQLDPDITMYGVQTMTEQLDRTLWARRAYSWLFAGFAILALLLAAAGVYGVVSYAVSQRVHEIGIRMALGARPGQVLGQVLLRGMSLVSLGATLGLLAAFWTTRLLRSLLFAVSSRDPLIYATIVVGVTCIGMLANFVPAFRAAKLHPMRALRVE